MTSVARSIAFEDEDDMLTFPADERHVAVTLSEYEAWYAKLFLGTETSTTVLSRNDSVRGSTRRQRSRSCQEEDNDQLIHVDPFERLYHSALELQESKRLRMAEVALQRADERRREAEADSSLSFRPQTTPYEALGFRGRNLHQKLFDQARERDEIREMTRRSNTPTFKPETNRWQKPLPKRETTPLWQPRSPSNHASSSLNHDSEDKKQEAVSAPTPKKKKIVLVTKKEQLNAERSAIGQTAIDSEKAADAPASPSKRETIYDRLYANAKERRRQQRDGDVSDAPVPQ